MLDSFPSLQVGVDLCGGGSCGVVSMNRRTRRSEGHRSRDLPAAAAGSSPVVLFPPDAGDWLDFPSGLRLRLESVCLEDGDRERRSNREGFRGSGSV